MELLHGLLHGCCMEKTDSRSSCFLRAFVRSGSRIGRLPLGGCCIEKPRRATIRTDILASARVYRCTFIRTPVYTDVRILCTVVRIYRRPHVVTAVISFGSETVTCLFRTRPLWMVFGPSRPHHSTRQSFLASDANHESSVASLGPSFLAPAPLAATSVPRRSGRNGRLLKQQG